MEIVGTTKWKSDVCVIQHNSSDIYDYSSFKCEMGIVKYARRREGVTSERNFFSLEEMQATR